MQQLNNKNDSVLFLALNLHQKNSEQGYNSAFARLQFNIISKLFLSSIVNYPSQNKIKVL